MDEIFSHLQVVCNTHEGSQYLRQDARDHIIDVVYRALKEQLDWHMVKDPEIKRWEMDELLSWMRCSIRAYWIRMIIKSRGARITNATQPSFGSTLSIEKHCSQSDRSRSRNDPNAEHIVKIMNPWFLHVKDNNRQGFYNHLREMSHLRKVKRTE